jgi:hypothetical protein
MYKDFLIFKDQKELEHEKTWLLQRSY